MDPRESTVDAAGRQAHGGVRPAGRGGELEAVFGYKNLSPLSVYAGLDPHVDIPEGNVIVRETRRRRASAPHH